MAIEIVEFPINSMVIFHSYVKLPEGITIGLFHGSFCLPLNDKNPLAFVLPWPGR